MKHITLDLIESSTSLEDLEKPASNLKVLREHYIYNNDVKSYNNLMYLVKDAVLLSGKEEMWPQFIDSKCFINVKSFIVIGILYKIYNIKSIINI